MDFSLGFGFFYIHIHQIAVNFLLFVVVVYFLSEVVKHVMQ